MRRKQTRQPDGEQDFLRFRQMLSVGGDGDKAFDFRMGLLPPARLTARPIFFQAAAVSPGSGIGLSCSDGNDGSSPRPAKRATAATPEGEQRHESFGAAAAATTGN
jgi:hypothetical protein